MSQSIHQLLETRKSTSFFDPHKSLADGQLEELVRLACLAPSAYHLQNWRFIAVRTPAAKRDLKAICFGQQKLQDASLSLIICGRLQAQRQLAGTLQDSVAQGALNAQVAQNWVDMATQAHEGNQQLQRDEALRSASLAAMSLMLAAADMGLATCPIGGFDAKALSERFDLADTDVAALIVAIGHEAPGNWPQKPRRPVAELLSYA